MSDVSQLVKCASLHSTLLRVKSELDQFISGLGAAHVLDVIREYPDLFAPLFVYQGKCLTAGKIRTTIIIHSVSNNYLLIDGLLDIFDNKMFSDQGSSQLLREQATYVYFRDLWYEAEGILYISYVMWNNYAINLLPKVVNWILH